MSLARKTFSAVRWTTLSALFRASLQLVQLAVLARLLTPADYGLLAMVTVVLGFASQFADMGANSAFVHKQRVTDEQRTSLYWLNVGSSIALMLLLILISPVIAWMMNEPRLTPLLMVMASSLFITALGQQVRMAAEKQLDFRPVVVLEITSALLGFGVAVLAAWSNFGVWAILAGSLTGSVVATAGAWLFLSRGWRLRWRFQWAEVRPFLAFGGALVANHFVNYLNASIDFLLVGRLLGASQLGIYSVPRNLVLQIQDMVNPIVTRVGFPLIAQMQHDRERVRSIYLKTMNMTASINAPIHLGMAFFAPEIVALLLGKEWQEVTPILQVLALWGMFRSLGNPVGTLLFGMGRADLSLKWNLGLTAVVPATLWLGAQWGTLGMAWALLVLQLMLFVPAWYFLIRPLCPLSLKDYAIVSFKPPAIAVVAVGGAFLLTRTITIAPIYLLAIEVIFSGIFYLFLTKYTNRDFIDGMTRIAFKRS